MTDAERTAFMDLKIAELSEHFEHVQVMATWQENLKTFQLKRGLGNWYARQGLAQEFINEDRAQENAAAVSRYLPKPPPEAGEEWENE